jgi:hypothetical protein
MTTEGRAIDEERLWQPMATPRSRRRRQCRVVSIKDVDEIEDE